MEFTNSTQWASESAKRYYMKGRQPSPVSENSTAICSEAFWFGLKQGEDKTMNKRHKEDLSRNVKRKQQKKDPENDPREQKVSEKNNRQVHKAVRSKSDYLIKASISFNWKQCTLLTGAPFSRTPQHSRATVHTSQSPLTPASQRSLVLYKIGRLDGTDVAELSSHLELETQENKPTQLDAKLELGQGPPVQ